MPKIVELRQDRAHVRSNFDGYKLSLDAVPLLRQELTAPPLKAEPSDEQYSLLHAELFSMQNLLQSDPWARNYCYFVNRLGELVRSGYNENIGRPETPQVVYRLEAGAQQRISGDYNCSMRFISEKYCVVCDGVSQLQLLDTGDRLKAPQWKQVAHASISDSAERNFMLYDCRLDTIQEQKEISLALGRVQREDTTADGGSSFYLHLHWAKWTLKDIAWSFAILDTLVGKGSLYYCAFEPRAESLVISSNREFKFRSQNEITTEQREPLPEEQPPQLHNGSAAAIGGFTWTQTDEDIVVKFDARTGRQRAEYDVECSATQISVKCAHEPLLDSALFDKVDEDLTTWRIENDFLQITLVKQASAHCWTSLLADGAGPKESPESAGQKCIPVEQQPIANLEAPIEDCDFPMGSNEFEIKIERFNLPTKSITHAVLLGSSPPLFATSLRPGFPLALATRLDVDACLWLQQYNPSRPEEWSLRHEGNLHAFGYVQASKQQKKFMDCSPDLNYAVICESHRHIFLYKSNYDTANGLRNRSGPQVTLGKQHLIGLEDAGEILGIATANSVLTLLTQTNILYLQIN